LIAARRISTSDAVVPPPEISDEQDDWILLAASVRVALEHVGVDELQRVVR
jgi:hypothetical protein